MKDTWQSGDPYDFFMGRWSSIVATSFTDWLSPSPGLTWLDIGCGSGALSEAVINRHRPVHITAIDQSEGFVNTAQKRLGNRADCKVGNALSLPLEDSSVEVTISGLVLNFIPEPEKALAEMRRVTMTGGTIAVYVWDYAGKMDFLKYFWDIAVELNPKAATLHESTRFSESNKDSLKSLFDHAGILNTVTAPIEIKTNFRDFNDYWNPFLGGQGPAPSYVKSLNRTERNKLRDLLHERLPFQVDGSIPMGARAWAAMGQT